MICRGRSEIIVLTAEQRWTEKGKKMIDVKYPNGTTGDSKSNTVINSSTANALSRNPLYEPPLVVWVVSRTWTSLPEPYKGERRKDAEIH